MKEKTYTLTVTESQLHLIANAVEDWHRFLAGQCEMAHATSLLADCRDAQHALNDVVRPYVVPELLPNASYSWDGGGCPNKHLRKAIAMSYGIYREILHYLATHPEEKSYSIYQAPTLRCEEQGPLVKIGTCGYIDLELTPEDIGKIFNKVRELQKNCPATVACYADVAEWFNEQRKKD